MENYNNKGLMIAGNLIFVFVVGAMVLVVALAVIFFVVPEISAYIFGQTTSEIVEAIKCSYYRCSNGCSYAENVVNDDVFDCSRFCSAVPSEFRPGNKICGSNARMYPVILNVAEDNIVSKSASPTPRCIIPTDSAVSDAEEHYIESVADNWIVVDDDVVLRTGDEETCELNLLAPYRYASYDAYSSLTLSGGSVYIFTDILSGKWRTEITDNACDVTLQQGVKKQVELPYGDINEKLICISDVDYSAGFSYREGLGTSIYVTMFGSSASSSEVVPRTMTFYSEGHMFDVDWLGSDEDIGKPRETFEIIYTYSEDEEEPLEPGTYLPSSYPVDSWTESLNGWSGNGMSLVEKSSHFDDVKKGDYSISYNGNPSAGPDAIFSVSDLIGSDLDLTEFDILRFWMKSGYESACQIRFEHYDYATSGLIDETYWMSCSFDKTSDWSQYEIDLNNNRISWDGDSNDCYVSDGFDSSEVETIELSGGYSVGGSNLHYFDELYLLKLE